MKWLLAVLFSLVFVAANTSTVYAGAPGTTVGHSKRKPPSPPWIKTETK